MANKLDDPKYLDGLLPAIRAAVRRLPPEYVVDIAIMRGSVKVELRARDDGELLDEHDGRDYLSDDLDDAVNEAIAWDGECDTRGKSMIDKGIKCENVVDENGRPSGGYFHAIGLSIQWQNGPLVDSETGERKSPNGAFVETVVRSAKQRLEFYQSGRFRCIENGIAISHLEMALKCLEQRTRDREARGVEGTHQM